MIDRQALVSDLRRQLRLLERDLAQRADTVPEMAAALDAEYQAAREAERTAATFSVWRAGELTQAAVAWLLGCVFVRFIEDNRLIDEPLISGPHPRDRDAADSQTFYFHDHPTATFRDYLLHCFSSVARLPALAKLYDRRHNPVWRLGISGDAARDLLWFTVRDLALRAGDDADFHKVADRLWEDLYPDHTRMIADLVAAEHVPALPAQRYKPSGLAKRADWEAVWIAQRREDEIDAEAAEDAEQRRKRADLGVLVPPPKYRAADFRKPSYWRLRGALDVPKERFVSFPNVNRDDDPTLLLGWAGWDALTFCQAVGTYYIDARFQDQWDADRLAPLLAVIYENLPWLKQWHNEFDPDFEVRLGDYYDRFVHTELRDLGLSVNDLRPPASG